jgi:hypothetical protein
VRCAFEVSRIRERGAAAAAAAMLHDVRDFAGCIKPKLNPTSNISPRLVDVIARKNDDQNDFRLLERSHNKHHRNKHALAGIYEKPHHHEK